MTSPTVITCSNGLTEEALWEGVLLPALLPACSLRSVFFSGRWPGPVGSFRSTAPHHNPPFLELVTTSSPCQDKQHVPSCLQMVVGSHPPPSSSPSSQTSMGGIEVNRSHHRTLAELLCLARACAARVDRRSMPGDWRTGASPRQTMAGGDVGGRVTDGVDSPVAVGGRIAQGQWLFNRGRAGFACVNKPGWLWPLRMAKRVSERATRGGEHGGIGTPHARGASGEILGVGSEEASSISFCLRARWLVSSLTRRRGKPRYGDGHCRGYG